MARNKLLKELTPPTEPGTWKQYKSELFLKKWMLIAAYIAHFTVPYSEDYYRPQNQNIPIPNHSLQH